jgi:hypothetical protein
MLPDDLYIVSSCSVNNHAVQKDGKTVFTDKPGTLSSFLLTAYHHFGFQYPKYLRMDNMSRLGLLATEVLLKDSFQPAAYRSEEIGVVLSNSSASLDTDFKYYETVSQMASPSLFVYTLPNIVIGEICIRNNFKGENAFFIFDHFDADFTRKYVTGLLCNGMLRVCICGWVEVMAEKYRAVLYLVEKKPSPGQAVPTPQLGNEVNETFSHPGLIFTNENMLKIFEEHG